MAPKNKRAVVYTRISKDLREGAGIARQKDDCIKHCQAHNYEIVEVLADNDTSAFSRKVKRPAYDRMLKMARNGDMDIIVAWHPDRLYRRLSDLEGLMDACEPFGVEIQTVQGSDIDLSTATGRLLAGLLAANSRFEVDHQIERQRAAHADRAARGRYRGGPRPFGFQTVPGKPGALVHDELEAEAIRIGIDDVLAGKSLNSIARKWIQMGVAKEGAKSRFGAAKVRKRLSNPRIAGLEPHQGETYPATTYTAIVSEDKWRAAVDILEGNTSRSTRGQERKWIGTGIYRCGRCGGHMAVVPRKRPDGTPNPAYQCRSCLRVSVLVAKCDEVVVETILAYLDRPENRLQLTQKDTPDGEDLQHLVEKREGIRARMNELAVMLAEGELTASQFRAGNERLKRDFESVERSIARLSQSSPLATLVLAGDDLRSAWERLNPSQQSRVVDALVTVRVMPTTNRRAFDPSRIQLEWK